MRKDGIEKVISCLKENDLLNEELEALLLDNIEKEEINLILHQVTNTEQLNELNNYQIEHMIETEGESGRKGTNIVLKRELPCGGYMYRDFLISGDGNKYISDEY
jgi:hypothetical protein